MTTRIGYGLSGTMNIETDDNRVVRAFPDGVRAEFAVINEVDHVILHPARSNGTKCHFHQHGGLHKVSITDPHITGVKLKPFRLHLVGDTNYAEEADGNTHNVSLQLANIRHEPINASRKRKTGRGPAKPFSGTPTPGQRQLPLDPEPAPEDFIEDLREAMNRVNKLAKQLDVELCFDDDGDVYAKIAA